MKFRRILDAVDIAVDLTDEAEFWGVHRMWPCQGSCVEFTDCYFFT
ncbi:hypothetical protein H206_06333 [Candidatus Electrothrix aarhusensis]|uniref:Uncharacterized protein n=1 Tax=Candidatus Electrothrix aarhusensis TaxID=1859131 RepID=A0A444J2X7_9BACT|nr:hypothetical protein H206_06333 [Candidatus Electrothrix aarhusensis]